MHLCTFMWEGFQNKYTLPQAAFRGHLKVGCDGVIVTLHLQRAVFGLHKFQHDWTAWMSIIKQQLLAPGDCSQMKLSWIQLHLCVFHFCLSISLRYLLQSLHALVYVQLVSWYLSVLEGQRLHLIALMWKHMFALLRIRLEHNKLLFNH